MKALLAAALLALLVAPAAAAAQDDAPWRLESRQVQAQATSAGFAITSSRDSALGTDTLAASFDAAFARLDATLAASQPEPASVPLGLTLSRLVEFRDADGDGRYGLADPALQAIAVPGLPQSVLVAPALAGQAATATYTLPANDTGSPVPVPGSQGTLRLTVTALHDPAAVDGASLAPADLGVAVEVRGFPWSAPDTRLALVVAVAAADGLSAGAGNLSSASGPDSWVAAWAPQAKSDGAPVAAAVSTLARSPIEADLVLAWPHGQSASQAMTLSAHHLSDLAKALAPLGDWRVYAAGLAGTAVVLGVPSWRRLRGA